MTGGTNTFVAGVDFANSGLVTLGDGGGDTFAFDGGLAFSGGSAIEMGAAITTDGFSIDFGAGGVTLLSNSSVDTTDAGGFADGAAITFGGTVGGAFDLALTAGADAASDINFDGVDAAGAVTVNNLTLNSGNSSTIAGNINITDLITDADLGTMTMTGASNTFANEISFNNGYSDCPW